MDMELPQRGEQIKRPVQGVEDAKPPLRTERLDGLNPDQWRYVRERLKNALTHKNFFERLFAHGSPSVEDMNRMYGGRAGCMLQVNDGGMPVGFLAVRIITDTEKGTFAVIEHVRVDEHDPDALEELLKQAVQWARDKSISSLSVSVGEDNMHTTTVLQRSGFEPGKRADGAITLTRNILG